MPLSPLDWTTVTHFISALKVLSRLQIVQNAAARLFTSCKRQYHITLILILSV